MEEKVTLNTALKVWLWIVFVVNIISAIVSLVGIPMALLLGPVVVILYVVSVVLYVVLLVGVATMLFKQKKSGFYLICGSVVANFIIEIILDVLLGTFAVSGIVTALIRVVLFPLVIYLFAKPDWDKLN